MDNQTSPQRSWPSGWTLSAPLEELFSETTSPLTVTLSAAPGTLELSSPGASFLLDLLAEGSAAYRVSASGLRMTFSHTGRDAIFSAVVPDPATVIVEIDASLLEPIMEREGFEKSIDEAFWFQSADKHGMAILVDIKASPMRLAAVAGTGDPDIMRSRARGYLSRSAHIEMDERLRQSEGRESDPAHHAGAFIQSRMRAATSRIPYPWPADADDEPVWDLALLYPVFEVLLNADPDVAEGLINNVMELMDEHGDVPIAGGSIGPLMLERTAHPVLAGMCKAYYDHTGSYPAEAGTLMPVLCRYVNRVIDAMATASGQSPVAAETQLLLYHDLNSFKLLAKSCGKLSEKNIQKVIQAGTEALSHLGFPGDDAQSAIAALIIGKKADTDTVSAGKAADSLIQQFTSGSSRSQPALPCLILLTGTGYQRIDYRAYSEWIHQVHTAALDAWTAQPPQNSAEDLARAGLVAVTDAQRTNAFNTSKLREQRVLYLINRHKKWGWAAAAVILITLVSFLISVQMRQTMPISVYETNIGMVLQFYQTEHYADALDTISEMEARGARNNPNLRFLKGKTYFKLGQYADAAEQFLFCAERVQDNPSAYYNLGLCHYYTDDFAAAADVFGMISERYRATHPPVSAMAVRALDIVEKARTAQHNAQQGGEKE